MKTEQQQLSDMYAGVRQVFPAKFLDTLAKQQENLIDAAIHRVVQKEGHEAVTVDRPEGIKELVTQQLWSSALTEASKSLPPSQTETSKAPPVSNERPQASAPQGASLHEQQEPYQSPRRRNCLILNLPD